MKFSLKRVVIVVTIVIVIIAVIGGAYYYFYGQNSTATVTYKTTEEKNDVYVRFAMEAYDKIVQNYWAKTQDAGLAEHFQLSLQKALGNSVLPPLSTRDRAGTAQMLTDSFKVATSSPAKKKLAVDTLIVALYNLPPIGRGQLFSAKQEIALRQNVSNINPTNDLYQNLGLAKGATSADVDKAYIEKSKALETATSSLALAELKKITYAKQVLTNPLSKDLYDTAKIEPTVTNQVIGKTLYIGMSKIAPTTFIEFGRIILSATTTSGLNSMIIDLRGNLGGALDFSAQFLGLFIGQNQYAFDLFQQGNYNVQRTTSLQFPELARFKEIAILTDNMTQSTAEVTTAAMRRFNLARVVGGTTRGWGTVENTFPLETIIDPTEKYSMFLVHSLTLREDNQPIEGRGVDPDVSIKDPSWRNQLSNYFRSPDLISAIKKVAIKPPF